MAFLQGSKMPSRETMEKEYGALMGWFSDQFNHAGMAVGEYVAAAREATHPERPAKATLKGIARLMRCAEPREKAYLGDHASPLVQEQMAKFSLNRHAINYCELYRMFFKAADEALSRAEETSSGNRAAKGGQEMPP